MSDEGSTDFTPTPAPRMKVPVPLPRTKVSNENTVDRVSRNSRKDEKTDSRSLNRSSSAIRKSLRMVTANVQEKGSAVIENTKLVSAKLEKSVKSILKRHSTASTSENDTTDTDSSQFDPASSYVFNDISFVSPIVNEDRSLPPPYPPPPLPNDIYDEVKSNASESHYSYPASPPKSESFYEEIPFMKELSLRLSPESDSESSHSESWDKYKRSDSWNYFSVEKNNAEKPVFLNDSSSGSTSDSSRAVNSCNEVLHSYENFIPTKVSLQSNVYSENPCKGNSDKAPSVSGESGRSVVNSVYENWGPIAGEDLSQLEIKNNPKPLLLHSDILICEFDPLFKENPILQKVYESRMKFRHGDLNFWEDESKANESIAEESIYEMASNCSEGNPEVHEESKDSEDSIVDDPQASRKKLARWSSMKRAMQKMKEVSLRKSKSTDSCLPHRPPTNLPTSIHTGYLYKTANMLELPKNLIKKWCQLGEGKLSFSSDKNTPAKDVIALDNIYSIQLILDPKFSENNEVIHCWEVTHLKGKSSIIGCSAPTERRIWMQKILESLTQAFPTSLASSYTRAGWAYLRENINGPWHIAWLLLQKRTLHYSIGKGTHFQIDLRKIINIELSTKDDMELIVIDTQEMSIRLQVVRDVKAWAKVIKSAALDNGTSLSEQQLTKDNIPTIVEKCISFVYAHGCMSEGIYRRSGSNANVQKLLTDLRKDAWAVMLSQQDYSEYDVSNVLKRFFRDLPDPLFTAELHDYLCNASSIKCNKSDKVSMYRGYLEKLPLVNYVTARKLMSHLYFINQQSEKNLMTTDNLAAIWAPTLMHVQDNENSKWSKQEWQVIQDLITLYKPVFLVGESELAIEKRIQEVLENVHKRGGPNHHQPSGDLKIWVYIGSKESGTCINITVDPERSAGDVVQDLCVKKNLLSHEQCLQEVCLSGSLIRPLHHGEKVFQTVIRWAYWHHDHRKDNHLLLTENTIFKKVAEAIVSPPLSKCGELKFASPKMKSFKTYLFEFSQAKLSYFKDSKLTVKLGEWRIEDVVFYQGHDLKRQIQAKWTLTLVPKGYAFDESKEYGFGFTLGGAKDDLFEWLSAFHLAQYNPEDILPKKQPTQLIPIFTDSF